MELKADKKFRNHFHLFDFNEYTGFSLVDLKDDTEKTYIYFSEKYIDVVLFYEAEDFIIDLYTKEVTSF